MKARRRFTSRPESGKTDLVRYLLAKGANTLITDADGKRPIDLVSGTGQAGSDPPAAAALPLAEALTAASTPKFAAFWKTRPRKRRRDDSAHCRDLTALSIGLFRQYSFTLLLRFQENLLTQCPDHYQTRSRPSERACRRQAPGRHRNRDCNAFKCQARGIRRRSLDWPICISISPRRS